MITPCFQLLCVGRRHLRPPHNVVAYISRGCNERVSTAHSVAQAEFTSTIVARSVTKSFMSSMVPSSAVMRVPTCRDISGAVAKPVADPRRPLRDESLRSTIGIAAVQTAIEYEHRFTEYEHDKIRCEARTSAITHVAAKKLGSKLAADRRLGCVAWFVIPSLHFGYVRPL